MSANDKREDELVPMRIIGLAMDPFNNSPIVLLRDKRPLFEIIAAMRKKRAATQPPPPQKDDILSQDNLSSYRFNPSFDLSSIEIVDDDPSSEDAFDSEEADASEDIADASQKADASEGIADASQKADASEGAEEAQADDVEESRTFDDLASVSAQQTSESFEALPSTAKTPKKRALRAEEVERMLAAMQGGPQVRIPHPSSREQQDPQEQSTEASDTSADAMDSVDSVDERDSMGSSDERVDRAVERDGEEDDERRALLPIWIGEAEANAIATELLGIATPRPMTHDLLKQAIAAMGGAVARVIVTDIRENTFYAAIEVRRSAEEVISLDARPSDALALALRFGADIFVHDRVLEKTQQREKSSTKEIKELNEVQEERWKDSLQRRNEDSLDKYKQ
jgi:bifunctional DNase/RNase